MSYSIKGYSNLRKITEGGMGVIYYGIERSRNRTVVIKKLNYEKFSHPFNFKKFENEAAILTSLYHDSIIRTYGYGESNESQYIVMEYIDGPDLEKLMSWPNYHRDIGLMAVFQALQGLHFAHRKGLIHGDIKPSNILISQSGQAKLSDFGLSQSKMYSTHMEEIKNDLTTPLYMPPEQAKMVVEQTGIVHGALAEPTSNKYSDRAPEQQQTIPNRGIQWDIWSVGVLLYRVCSGTYPFFGKDLAGLFHAIAGIREKNIQEVVPDLPPYLAQVITACLEKEGYKRPPSLEPILSTIQRYFTGVSIEGSEKAIRKFISANMPVVSEQRKAPPPFEDDELDKRLPSAQRIQGSVVAKTKPLHHSKLLPSGIYAGMVLIVLSGILFFWFVYRDAGTTTRIDDKQLIAATNVPKWKEVYKLTGAIQTEQTGITNGSSRRSSKNSLKGGDAEEINRQLGRENSVVAQQSSRKSGRLPQGILKITLDPAGATVVLKGRVVSRAEVIAGARMSAGACEILVQHPGYEPYKSTLQIEEGKTLLVSVVLQPVQKGFGRLHIYSYPWADLYIDGELTGTAPTQSLVSLVEGEHMILIKRDGYQPYTESIQVKKDEVTRLQITLNKIESP